MTSSAETIRVRLTDPKKAKRYTLNLDFNGILDAWKKEGINTPADIFLAENIVSYMADDEEKRSDLKKVIKAVMIGPSASYYVEGLNILDEFAQRYAQDIRNYAESRLAEQRSPHKRFAREIAGIASMEGTTSTPSQKVSRRQTFGYITGGALTLTGVGKTVYSATVNGKLENLEVLLNSAEMGTGIPLMVIDGLGELKHHGWPEIVDKINAKLAEVLGIEYPGQNNSLKR